MKNTDEYRSFQVDRFYSDHCGEPKGKSGTNTQYRCPKANGKGRSIYVSETGVWSCHHSNCPSETGCTIQKGTPRHFLTLVDPTLTDLAAFEQLNSYGRRDPRAGTATATDRLTPTKATLKVPAKNRKTYPSVAAFAKSATTWPNVTEIVGTPTTLAGTYPYPNPNGDVVGVVVRIDGPKGKVYMQGRAVTGGIQAGAIDDPRPLYRLSDNAAKNGRAPVIVTEGEKCCDALAQAWSGPATWITTPMQGAKSPSKTDWSPMKARRVVILPDDDDAGVQFAAAVADLCRSAGATSVKIVHPFYGGTTGEGDDIADFIERHGSYDEIAAAIEKATECHATEKQHPHNLSNVGDTKRNDAVLAAGAIARQLYNPHRDTELGNAERLIEVAERDLLYARDRGWMYWDGKRWAADEDRVRAIVLERLIPKLFAEVSAKAADHDHKAVEALSKWARRSESARVIGGTLELAKSFDQIVIDPGKFDRDEFSLNCINGIVDLATGALRQHRREALCTRVVPVAYDPTSTCPRWLSFLDEIMGGDRELVAFLQRAVGYSLTGTCKEHAMFILHGNGSNGKTVFCETVLSMIGDDYATETTADTLMVKRNDGGPNSDVARLVGVRMVGANETEEGGRLAESRVKGMTGGDQVAARFLHHEWFTFRPVFKLWLRTNHRPVIRGTDEGIWRRLLLIPFKQNFPESRRDLNLSATLRNEMPGILTWAVQGCIEWQRVGLSAPNAVKAASNEYRQSQDVLSAFFGECCYRQQTATVPAKALYAAYTEWCQSSGERELSQRRFGEALSERGHTRKHTWMGWVWIGVGIIDHETSKGQDLTLCDDQGSGADTGTAKGIESPSLFLPDPSDPKNGKVGIERESGEITPELGSEGSGSKKHQPWNRSNKGGKRPDPLPDPLPDPDPWSDENGDGNLV